MAFEIFCDSAANLPDDVRKARGVHIISFTFLVNGEERMCFSEDVAFRDTAKTFYAEMRSGADIKTSLVSEQHFIDALTPALEAGKDALIITIASGISGTYQQACRAAEALKAAFPARKVVVKDSANASMGQGLLALYAADMRDAGKSIDECAKWLDENTYRLNSYLTVEDLKYMRKSGRISLPLAIVGTLLNIKPILKASGEVPAQIVYSGREHGRKKAINALAEAFRQNVIDPQNQTVAITHGDCEEEALALAETVKKLGARDVIVEYYDLCTGSHVGPGTIALFFMGKDRKAAQK